MKREPHPYKNLPDSSFWYRSISNIPISQIDPVVRTKFKFNIEDHLVSAGSCFAQHTTKSLVNNGLNYFFAENPHPIVHKDDITIFNYNVYSARYGNIYTANQLLQLYNRAYENFHPEDSVWELNGTFIDPFRPIIQPNGYSSQLELELDRENHLSAVRRAFEKMDVFIFTLGLTESWRSINDGATFPIAPGVHGGHFSDDLYYLHNFDVDEIVRDMMEFISAIHAIKPSTKFILTVSPLPLVATAVCKHILTANHYSKSVLRVAVEKIISLTEYVDYFPSYEIIDGSYNKGVYFNKDNRSISDEGVNRVMSLFFCHYVDNIGTDLALSIRNNTEISDHHTNDMQNLIDALCDEVILDNQH